jgi:hypothetical protein
MFKNLLARFNHWIEKVKESEIIKKAGENPVIKRLSGVSLPYQVTDRFCFVCFLKNERNRVLQKKRFDFQNVDCSCEGISLSVCGLIVQFESGRRFLGLCAKHNVKTGIWANEAKRMLEDFYNDRLDVGMRKLNKKTDVTPQSMTFVEDLSCLDPTDLA